MVEIRVLGTEMCLAHFALKLAIRLSAIRAVSGKVPSCHHGVLEISNAV
jgi:hypothetical protein